MIGLTLMATANNTAKIGHTEVLIDQSNGKDVVLQGKGDDGNSYTLKIETNCTDVDLGSKHLCLRNTMVEDKDGNEAVGFSAVVNYTNEDAKGIDEIIDKVKQLFCDWIYVSSKYVQNLSTWHTCQITT